MPDMRLGIGKSGTDARICVIDFLDDYKEITPRQLYSDACRFGVQWSILASDGTAVDTVHTTSALRPARRSGVFLACYRVVV
jgi:hypothetical protein